MKRLPVILFSLLLMLAMPACEFAGITVDLGSGEKETQQASVEAGIDSPPNGAVLKVAPVDITYHASSLDGISAVELSVDGEVVNSFAIPASDQKVIALKYTWQPISAGSHIIRVRAQSTAGLWSDFVDSTVTVEEAEAMSTAQVPGSQNTPEPPAAPLQPTETPKEFTFYDIKQDKDKFYYGGSSCGSREITISTRVTHPDKVFGAYLFTRFYDKEDGGITKWDSGHGMRKTGSDTWSVTLVSNQIANYNTFEYTIMEYQIVVQDKVNSIFARSEVVKKVTMEICP